VVKVKTVTNRIMSVCESV